MKDIVITSKTVVRELYVLCGCFAAAFIVNAYAVIAFSRPWTELFSQLGYVAVITLVFYAVLLVFRLIYLAVTGLIRTIRH